MSRLVRPRDLEWHKGKKTLHRRRLSLLLRGLLGCAAAISITIYQQPDTTQFGSQGLAGSRHTTSKCQKRIEPRASGDVSDFQRRADASPQKQRCSGAAGRRTRLRRIYPAQPRMRIKRRSATAREIKIRLRKVTAPGRARVCYSLGVCASAKPAGDLVKFIMERTALGALLFSLQNNVRYVHARSVTPQEQRVYPQRRRMQELAY